VRASAPTAPPLPFASWAVTAATARCRPFLDRQRRVYDVKIGDNLNHTYSAHRVKSGQLLLTYMPLKSQQSLAVGDE
jgi:hypothetical protein